MRAKRLVEFVDRLRDDVQRAGAVGVEGEAAGLGDVDPRHDFGAAGGFRGGLLALEGGGEGGLDFVHPLAKAAFFGAGKRPEMLGGILEQALAAQIFDAKGLEFRRRCGGGKVGSGVLFSTHQGSWIT